MNRSNPYAIGIMASVFAGLIGFFVGNESVIKSSVEQLFLLIGAVILAGLLGAFGSWVQQKQAVPS
jgi:hypothetical protein